MKLLAILLIPYFFLLHAQPVQFGVKGGVSLTEPTRYTSPESRRYTLGPTVEFQLPRQFAIETGFLYKRVGTGFDFQFPDYKASQRSRGNSFEIPVVGKYYFRPPSKWTPYLGLGVAMRRTWQSTEGTSTSSLGGSGQFRFSSVSPWGAGAVGAAGLRFQYRRWKFSPEFRYTRWSQEGLPIQRNPNQVDFLFGISF
ncbi:MAG: outer membrane beta-barrel protein [Bryobacterales bacterium]|nr:outer membrane beta-barrel protein [Bryobacterales bacterium]